MERLEWLSYDLDNAAVRQRLQNIVKRQAAQQSKTYSNPDTIYLYVTKKCNLACKHCYIDRSSPTQTEDFAFASIQKLIEQALRYGLKKVKVTGGEPFESQNLFEVLDFLNSKGLAIVLETNATLFQKDTIQQLSSLNDLTISVSLDHLEAYAHDDLRGVPGSYRNTTTVLKELGQTSIQSVVTTVASRYNYHYIVELADTVLNWGIHRHRTLLNIHPLGNAAENLDLAITMEEAKELISSLLGSPHLRTGRVYMTLPPALTPLDMLQDFYACGWGNNVVGVLPTGDVTMCSASYGDPHMIGGNVFEQDLIDIWSTSSLFKRLREIRSGNVKGVCGNCIFYALCCGFCRFSSYAHYGEIDAPYPLCQEVYRRGGFPTYALVDPSRVCQYGEHVLRSMRDSE